jgi:hypothetical protein
MVTKVTHLVSLPSIKIDVFFYDHDLLFPQWVFDFRQWRIGLLKEK